MAERWYVAETKSRSERSAEQHLLRQKFEAFNPVDEHVEIVRHQRVTIASPIFPGYLLVKFDIDVKGWQRINGTRGVKRLMHGAGDRPIPIIDGVVEELKKRCDDGVVRDLLAAMRGVIQIGERARVMMGPWIGHVGECSWSNGEDRVRLLLMLFGRENEVVFSNKEIEKVV